MAHGRKIEISPDTDVNNNSLLVDVLRERIKKKYNVE